MKMQQRWVLATTSFLGLLIVVVGAAQASGNGGQCGGEWTEVYDPQTDSWSYEFDSFTCVGDCSSGEICAKKTIETWPNGTMKDRLCGCMNTGTGVVTFDPMIGDPPQHACDAVGHYAQGHSYSSSATCEGACSPAGPSCSPMIVRTYTEGGDYKRDYQCACN